MRTPALDVTTLYHKGDIAVLNERNKGGRRRDACHMVPGTPGRFEVLPGKNGCISVRLHSMLPCECNCRSRHSGGTSTHGVDYEDHGLPRRARKSRVNLSGCSQLINT